jgi:uncharacterized protein involved in cysteine biosynthesis
MFKNKAILTALVDAVTGIITIVVAKFAPDWSQFVVSLWGVCQPLALALIAYYAVEPVRSFLARQ